MADKIRVTADDLRARQLRVHARDGNLDAFNNHVKEMFSRGAGRAEQLQFRDLMDGSTPSRINIAVTTSVGRPRGAERSFKTRAGSVTKGDVGKAIFIRLGQTLAPGTAELTSVYDWGVDKYAPMSRRLLGKIWHDFRRQRLLVEDARQRHRDMRAYLDSAEGRAANPDADDLIAFLDERTSKCPPI